MGLIDSNPNRYLPYDEFDKALITIDTVHHEVHEGESWKIHARNIATASGVTSYIQVTAPATHDLHMFIEFGVQNGNTLVQFFRNGTVLTAGTVLGIYNFNENYADVTPVATAYQGSTVTTAGTAWGQLFALSASTNQSKTIAAIRPGAERVITAGHTMFIGITPQAASVVWTMDAYLEEVEV